MFAAVMYHAKYGMRLSESPPTSIATTSTNKDILTEDITPTWREKVDLGHFENEKLRTRIIGVLEKHALMWNGKLRTTKASEHWIEVKPGKCPVRSMKHRQEPAMREHVKSEIDKLLSGGVIEPVMSG